MSIEFVRKALDRSFIMGQDYYVDADSESLSANRRSDVTRQKFNTMRDEICEATAAMLAEKDALLQQALDAIESECGFGGTNTYDPRAICDAIRKNLGIKND